MTNLLVTVTVSLATNWTGHVVGTNELGYVTESRVVREVCGYHTNSYVVQDRLLETKAWRPAVRRKR